MRKIVLFGLVISLLVPGCSGDSDHTGAGDGDGRGDEYGDEYGDGDGDPGTDRAEDGDGCETPDDGGGGEVDCRFDPAIDWWIIGEILQMESADGETCVWLKRKNECPPGWICKAIPFTLEQVRIGHDGQVREFDDSNATLTWTPSHHNWEDSATIDTGTTVFTLSALDYGHAYEITATGGETWGPIRLDPWEP